MLKSAASFVECWLQIAALRAACGAEEDVLLSPLDFLARLSPERRSSCAVACWQGEELVGLLFVMQHMFFGLPTGYAIGGDYSGRGLLLCRPEDECVVIQAAVERILAEKIHSLHLRIAPRTAGRAAFPGLAAKYLEMVIPGDCLQLAPTFDEFLATLGKHTRRNIRSFMRRTADAGLRFEPWLAEEEFIEARERLNLVTPFPVKRAAMEEGDRVLALHLGGQKMGLRAADGSIVALLSGFSRRGRFHLLTQWNDHRLQKLSLSLALRGYAIDHLIACGHSEVHFLGGLSLSLGRFCPSSLYCSLSVDRPRGLLSIVKRLAARYCRSRARAGKSVPPSARTLSGGFLDDSLLSERVMLTPEPSVAESM